MRRKGGTGVRPVREIGLGPLRIALLPVDGAQVKEIVLEPGHQIRIPDRALVRLDELGVEETDDQGGVIRGQQTQRGVRLLELEQLIVVHRGVQTAIGGGSRLMS